MTDGLLDFQVLTGEHEVAGFDCGSKRDNDFLIKEALKQSRDVSSMTCLALQRGEIVGYFSVSLIQEPAPTLCIGRLCVARARQQDEGILIALLEETQRAALSVADTMGVGFILANTENAAAKAFYRSAGLQPVADGALLLLKNFTSLPG